VTLPVEGSAVDAEPDPGHSALRQVAREVVVLVVTALVIAVVVKSFVAQAFYIPSGSMLPQLQINDRVVVSKVSYRLHDPRRGDIVVFAAPGVGTTDFAAVIVPPHTLWVMGDNRGNSADSRVFGPVPRSTVVGRAFSRVWPLDHTSFL